MQTRSRLLLVFMVGVWMALPAQRTVAAMDSHVCSESCVGTAACNDECWLTQFDWEQSYPSTTCGAQGYQCCGDGACNANTEGCNACPDDCGAVTSCMGECLANSHCAYGEVCNAARECVTSTPTQTPPSPHPPCGGSCTTKSECCGSDVCLGSPGQKYCGIPQSTYCPDAPPCSENNCVFGWYCESSHRDGYCDPGTNRCMFIDGPECPDPDTNICDGV